jgi:hypothetical protein
MTPTATKPPKPKPAQSPLKALEEREAEITALRAEARDLGRRSKEAHDQFRALHDERQRLTVREPGLFDHTGQPNPDVKDNPVAEVDKALRLLPDINDLAAQYEHSKKLQARAEQGLRDYVASRSAELAAALEPLAESVLADAEAKITEAQVAADAVLGFAQRWEQLVGERTPALDWAADLTKHLERVGTPGIRR